MSVKGWRKTFVSVSHLYERVSEALLYNPETGQFYWKSSNRGRRKGAQAGCLTKSGYKVIKLYGISFEAHRLAWLLYYKDWPANVIDHIDHDRSNNKIRNLRNITYGQNQLNRKAVKIPVSGRPGIRLNPSGSYAVFKLGSRTRKYLGTAYTLEDAVRKQQGA